MTEFSGLLGKHSKSPKKRLVYPNAIIRTGLDIVLQYCLFDAIADESKYTVQVLRKFVQNLFGSVKQRNSINAINKLQLAFQEQGFSLSFS